MDETKYLQLLGEIEVLRNVVTKLALEALAHNPLLSIHSPIGGYFVLSSIPKTEIYKLSEDFNRLCADWSEFFAHQLPWKGTPERREIDEILQIIGKAVRFEQPFRSRQAAYQEVFDLYISPFNRLERWSQRLVSYKTNAINDFHRTYEKEFSVLRTELKDKLPIFLSINYGLEESPDPPEVDEILRRRSEWLKDYGVYLLLAREYRRDPDLSTNTRILMHTCAGAMAFFTRSNQKDRLQLHNPNVCLEVGYLRALDKPIGLFMHSNHRFKIPDFALIRGLLKYTYNSPQGIGQKVEEFFERQLSLQKVERLVV